MNKAPQSPEKPETKGTEAQNSHAAMPQDPAPQVTTTFPPEFGGRKGPEATRYGDWELNGKCVDF